MMQEYERTPADRRIARAAAKPATNPLIGTGDLPGLARTTAHTQLKTLPGRLELPTLRLTASRSNQLSYGSARASLQITATNEANPNTRCTIRCHRSSMCWCKVPFLDARRAVAQSGLWMDTPLRYFPRSVVGYALAPQRTGEEDRTPDLGNMIPTRGQLRSNPPKNMATP